MLMKNDKQVPFISIAITSFEDPFLPNSWAVEEQELFSKVDSVGFERDTVKLRTEKFDTELATRELFEKTLKKAIDWAVPGGPGDTWVFPKYGAIVIHISTHGVINRKGEPCLIFADSDPLDDTTWKPLTEVLSFISDRCQVRASRKTSQGLGAA